MAVERENYNQDELNSLAHLLRTFLPDHDDLSLNEGALLGQAEASKNEDNADVETVYEASNQSHRKATLPSVEPPVHSPTPALDSKPNDPDIEDDTPWDKAKDPDFEPNSISEEEEEEADSDATVEIPLSELREACPNLVPKVARERAARKTTEEHVDNRMKWYACFICDDQYGDVFSYTAHMNQHLEEAGSIKCDICSSSFPSQSLFTSHRKLSTFELLVDRLALKKAMDNGWDIKRNEGKRGRKGQFIVLF